MSVAYLTKLPQRRNRARKPAWTFAGLNIDQWQADSTRVRWAQSDPMFRDVLTVLINGRIPTHTTNQTGGHSEAYHLGVVRGYEAAIGVLQSLAHGTTPPPGDIGEPTYQAEEGQQL